MSLSTQKAHTKTQWRHRVHNHASALMAIATVPQTTTTRQALLYSAVMHAESTNELQLLDARSREIRMSSFSANFHSLTDMGCVQLFRFRRTDIMRLVPIIAWPPTQRRTRYNGYATDPLMATCIVLRRLATPARWCDLELLFGKHGPQLSIIFREALGIFMRENGNLLDSAIPATFMSDRASRYASSILTRNGCLNNVVAFIDGTVIGVARPGGNFVMQLVLYNGHKRKHAIKFQAVTTPDGLCIHLHGPEVGRRHDMYLYACSGLDDHLPQILSIDGKQYIVYGDSGYTWRVFLEVPFSGANVTVVQRAFNKAMSKVRITVEWFFMEVKRLWGLTDADRKLRLGEMPAGLIYRAAVLLTNLRNCVSPNIISQYFACAPPSLEEYIRARRPEEN